MAAKQLTLEGMQRGVRDSDVFLLLLTKRVLTRWFCRKELLTAIEEGTPIQLVVEEVRTIAQMIRTRSPR